MGSSVRDVLSKAELDNVIQEGSPVVLHFYASWCEASKHMDKLFSHLSTDFPHARFLRVEAEDQPEISDKYSVSAVPYFVFFKKGLIADRLEGANPSSLANKVAKLAGPINVGDPAAPASLGMAAGPTVLEVVKEISIENDLHTDGKLSVNLSDNLRRRLKQLVDSHPVMLFMKGTSEDPRCGFSRKVVDILRTEGVRFGSFDILSDNEVREGLKKFSDWPTFPQLFCKGEFVGGCDITIAMHESGELKVLFRDHGIKSETSGKGTEGILKNTLESRLEELINASPVMLFMKGSPDTPRCGFSSRVVDCLRKEGVSFGSFDILTDNEVREGLKVFSDWPTFPQLYYKGELVGGCDIVLEMQRSGELKSTFSD